MTAGDHPASALTPTDTAPDIACAMDALRRAGAEQHDPIQLHFIATLAQRVTTLRGKARALLEARLSNNIAELMQRTQQTTTAAMPLSRGAGVKPLSPLADLTQYLARHAHPVGVGTPAIPDGLLPELKAVSQFRRTWANLSANQQLNKALEDAPLQAGPINSHMLVLRSLTLMREISPDYVNRFMSYAEALISLEGIDSRKVFPAPSARPRGSARARASTAKKARA